LNTIDLRLVDGDRVVLWTRFDEAANSLALCDADGACAAGVPVGIGEPMAGDAATLYPAASVVQGSGATGPSVDLTVAFSLDAAVVGAPLRVDTAATEDSGAEQGFLPVGYLVVADASSSGSDDDGCAIQPARGGGSLNPWFVGFGLALGGIIKRWGGARGARVPNHSCCSNRIDRGVHGPSRLT
jgi:hypothetical protein